MGKQKTYAEHEIAVRVGSRIRKLRELQGITQIKLATDIGIRAGPLGWIEKGKHLPSGRVLYRLAKRLNVRIDDCSRIGWMTAQRQRMHRQQFCCL